MNRGFIRHTKNFPASRQEKVLAAAGIKILYRDNLKEALGDLRQGDGLAVMGWRGLAGRRDDIVAALDAIHAKGAHAIDAATGRRSDGRDGGSDC